MALLAQLQVVLRRLPVRWSPLMSRLVSPLLLLALLGCERPPDVVLISIDTLRVDRGHLLAGTLAISGVGTSSAATGIFIHEEDGIRDTEP